MGDVTDHTDMSKNVTDHTEDRTLDLGVARFAVWAVLPACLLLLAPRSISETRYDTNDQLSYTVARLVAF